MAQQMAQEGTLWPSNVIRLGPHWRNSKITWAYIVHAVATGFWHLKYNSLNMVGAI